MPLRPGRQRVRGPCGRVGPSRASRGDPGRLWPPRDARDVSLSLGKVKGPSVFRRNVAEAWGPQRGSALPWEGESTQPDFSTLQPA